MEYSPRMVRLIKKVNRKLEISLIKSAATCSANVDIGRWSFWPPRKVAEIGVFAKSFLIAMLFKPFEDSERSERNSWFQSIFHTFESSRQISIWPPMSTGYCPAPCKEFSAELLTILRTILQEKNLPRYFCAWRVSNGSFRLCRASPQEVLFGLRLANRNPKLVLSSFFILRNAYGSRKKRLSSCLPMPSS